MTPLLNQPVRTELIKKEDKSTTSLEKLFVSCSSWVTGSCNKDWNDVWKLGEGGGTIGRIGGRGLPS